MNAGRLARVYRWVEYAAFGKGLERCRFAWMEKLRGARRVLVLGEGDGRFVERLLAEAAGARVVVMEASAEMVERARQRVKGDGRVEWRQGDVLRAEWPEGPFDAVVTEFFLDCFEEAEGAWVVGEAARRLEAGGVWVVGEFGVPEGGWARVHARAWLWTMYRFFGVTTGLAVRRLVDWEGLMGRAGLEREAARSWRWGLIRAEVWRKPAR